MIVGIVRGALIVVLYCVIYWAILKIKFLREENAILRKWVNKMEK